MPEDEMVEIDVGRIAIDRIPKFIADLGTFCSTTDCFECKPKIIIDYPENKGWMRRPSSRGGPDVLVTINISSKTKEQIEQFIQIFFLPPEEITHLIKESNYQPLSPAELEKNQGPGEISAPIHPSRFPISKPEWEKGEPRF